MNRNPHSARLILLSAWAILFGWLVASGEVARYLGPRTFWVAWFGAIALAILVVLYGISAARSADSRRGLTRREIGGLLALLAPVLTAFILANASLGSLAAAQKLSSRGIDVDRLEEVLAGNSSEISFLQISVADQKPDFASQNGIVPGRPVKLFGEVLQSEGDVRGTFQLGRFYITCCVADSIPVGVDVKPKPGLPAVESNEWLQVEGPLAREGGHLVVAAVNIEKVPAPDNPYLAFAY